MKPAIETRERAYVVSFDWGGIEKQELYRDHAVAVFRARWLRDSGYLVTDVKLDGRRIR